jgi:hypothetical protein
MRVREQDESGSIDGNRGGPVFSPALHYPVKPCGGIPPTKSNRPDIARQIDYGEFRF